MKRLRNWVTGKSFTQRIEQQAAEAVQRAYPMYTEFLVRAMEDALDTEAFLEEVPRCPEPYRNALRNGWVCITVWAFNQALSQSFSDHPEIAVASLKMLGERVLVEKEWFDPSLCDAIQPHVDELMPGAWTNKDGRGVYPITYWLEAIARGAQMVWSADYVPDLQFSLFFAFYFPKLIIEVRDTTNRIIASPIRDL